MSHYSRQWPDVASVRHQARQDWEKQFKRSISIEERIGSSTPWWIVIVALVFFTLSVPHTMVVFNKITPDWGRVAPFGIEFGLLFASFRRRVGKMTMMLWVLEILLFFTAIIVNGAGSLEAVVKSTESVQGQSIAQLIRQLPELPATSQVALILVPVAALIIPIGTVAAGEGLAALVLERRSGDGLLEIRWRESGPAVEYEALRDAAIASGFSAREAKSWATQITGYGLSTKRSKRETSSVQQASSERPVNSRSEQPNRSQESSSGYTKRMDARSVIRGYVSSHPESEAMSLSEIVSAIQLETGIKVGRSSVHNVLHDLIDSEINFSGNGHGTR